jgi:hypothetical protein
MSGGASVDLANAGHRGALDDQALRDGQLGRGCHSPPHGALWQRAAQAQAAEASRRESVAAPLKQPHSLRDTI